MRFFLSAFDVYTLAFPADFISSIIIHRGNQNNDAEYISLPEILNNKNISIRHGIAVKNTNYILLAGKINSEADIPPNDIYSVPKTLKLFKFSVFFDGIKFANDNLILFLNPVKLIEYTHNKENFL